MNMSRSAAPGPPRLSKKRAIIATVVGGVLSQLAAVVAAVVVLIALGVAQGVKPEDAERLAANPLVLILSSPATSLTLLLVACVTPLLSRVPLDSALGLHLPPARMWPLALLAVPGVGAVGELFADALRAIAPNLTLGTLDLLVQTARNTSLWLLIPALAILPGVAEEAFFRGMLLRAFGNSWRAVLGVSVVFSLYHMDPQHVVSTLPIGLYLGWLSVRTNSTLLPMGVHVFNNALALAATHLAPASAPNVAESDVPLLWALALIGVGGLAITGLHFLSQRPNEEPAPSSPS